MRLSTLLAALPGEPPPLAADPEVTAVTFDSRECRPGAVFVAIAGFTVDGHRYVEAAAQRGAVAVVVEPGRCQQPSDWDHGRCAWIVTANTRAALSALAAQYHGRPGTHLRVVGVTGTDGKTTTSHMLATVLEPLGPTGMIGTARIKVGAAWEANPSRQTTLEATEVQKLLARMYDAHLTTAVIESSSHGLALHKLDDAAFDAAVYTNITEDHLDFHGTRAEYWAAKARLLELTRQTKKRGPRFAVLNADDASFPYLAERAGVDVISYGMERPADLKARVVEASATGSSIAVAFGGQPAEAWVPLPGAFNVANALAALATGLGFGLRLETVCGQLATFTGVPGRMERVAHGQPFDVVIDYAHTGHAFRKLLAVLRPLTAGRIIAVFGSAGEQSRERRTGMGQAAAESVDVAYLTSEDPRHEPPEEIIAGIASAMADAGREEGRHFHRIVDRVEAIQAAMAAARPGDLVLLAGKGHEQSIIIGGEKRPWDERAAAETALAALGYRG